jgi:hypothetical protein
MAGMTPHTERSAARQTMPMLNWVLRRDASTITCRLNVRGPESYEVCIVPHWAPSSAVIEQYESAKPALLRHAEAARRLRESGWIVIDHVAADGLHTAA